MKKTYCPHCLPTKRRRHFPFYLEYCVEKATSPVARLMNLSSQAVPQSSSHRALNSLWGLCLEALSLFGLVSFTSDPDETKLPNLALIFFREAQQRNIDIKAVKFLGKHLNEFKFCCGGKRYYFESIPITIQKPRFDVDNKYKVKTLLQRHGIPVPKGKAFVSSAKAMQFTEELGWPVVVKPVSGSLSWHVICPVNTEQELKEALKIAKRYRPDFMVEEYIEGELHRAAVVGQKYVFVSKKERANVVGDGRSTIEELIKAKNQDERRGHPTQKNTTLYQIAVDDALKQNLAKRGLNLRSALQQGQKVYLQDKVILACGCDIINLTDKVHPQNRELFLRIARILGTNLVGIDVLCCDITQPYTKQRFAVIEANSLPHIDMHQHPSHGSPSPVAEAVWDVVLEELDKRS